MNNLLKIFSIFFVLFLFFGVASASSDVNETENFNNENDANNFDDLNNNEEINEVNNNINNDEKNFTELNRRINENTTVMVFLEDDYCLEDDEYNTFKEGIRIRKNNYVLWGYDHILNAKSDNGSQVKILTLIGNNVEIKDIVFQFANAEEGGAIWVNGDDNVFINCTFLNNEAKYGGAIYTNGNNTKFINCTFINNKAEYGGASYVLGNDYQFINCTFINNIAKNASAIYNDGAIINISGGNFIENLSNEGIMIYNDGSLKITNSFFNSSNSNYFIYNKENSKLFIENNEMYSSNYEKILNHGNISSEIILKILDNETIKSNKNTNIILNASLSDNYNNIIVGQNITLRDNLLGDIVLSDYLNGVYYTSIFLSDIGTFNINGSYTGGKNITIKKGVLIVKNMSNIKLSINNITYGENASLFVNIANTTGLIQLLLNNEFYNNYTLNNSQKNINISNLDSGRHNITIVYFGDNTYWNSSESIILYVYQSNISLNFTLENMIYLKNQTINFRLNNDAQGEISLFFNNKTINKTVINGTVIFSDLDLNAGNHTIFTYYTRDNNYLPYNETIPVQIAKSDDNNLALNNSEIVYSENETIIIIVNPKLTGTVNVLIGDEIISDIPIINGTIVISGINLQAGNYSLEILYSGDSNFNSFNITLNLTVLKSNKTDIVVEDGNITASENQTLVIDINPDASGNITLIINEVEYIAPITNGTVIFSINDLNPRNYNGTIIYNGDDNFNGFNTTINFNIIKSNLILNSSDIFMFYHDGTRYIAILKDALANPIFNQTIYITVNGVSYERITNENGTVYLNLNLLPKEYNITAYYNGSAKYNNATITTTLIINSTIISNDLVKYYRNGTQYQITVLDNDGNPLTNQSVEFNINGVKYTRISDNNGIVRLSINLFPDNYTITARYNGLNQSNNIEVLATLIGKDLTKNFGNSEQYEITVLDGTGKPFANQNVTINIHGVFYNCLSDSNGIARLNINLNPGSYIGTSTWNGYSTSNKITINA